MISAIGSVGNIYAPNGVNGAQQALSAQTKSQLQSLGIDTTNITTETQGQAALQSSQGSQQSQNTQQTQGTQQSSHAGGGNSAIQSIKNDAIALAQKVGASVGSNDKLNDILSSISQALSNMQAQAANNPQKLDRVNACQSEYQSLCQSISSVQSSMEASKAQSQAGASQIQGSMNGLAIYNMAAMSMNMNTSTQKQ